MHGFNNPRHSEGSEKGYQIHDIWYTIQGEGPFAGMPAIFVRMTGCHYRCTFCDTEWNDEKDPYLNLEEIKSKISLSNNTCKLIVLTGGEPCRWDLNSLIVALPDYQIQIETAGSHWQDCLLKPNITIVCSPKTAKVHPKFYEHCDHWKYVVKTGDASDLDGLPVEGTQRTRHADSYAGGPMARPPTDRKVNIYLQPCDEGDKAKNLANTAHMIDIALKYGYRAGLQLHKIFGVP